MVFFSSSFHHHMSLQSLLDVFTHISSNAFRTFCLKDFHKSGPSVLTSSFSLFSDLTLVQFLFSFPCPFCAPFLTIFFIIHLSRFSTLGLSCSSLGITFTSGTYFLSFFTTQNKFLFYIHLHYKLFFFSLHFEPTYLPPLLFYLKISAVFFLPHFLIQFPSCSHAHF